MQVKANRRIAIVSATLPEVKECIDYLHSKAKPLHPYSFQMNRTVIDVLISGIGSIQTAVNCCTYICNVGPDFMIQAGIGGSYVSELEVGEVVYITQERMIDLGIELSDGTNEDLFAAGLIDSNQYPFTDGLLKNPDIPDPPFMKLATANSVERVSGALSKINWIQENARAEVESMEGAAFFYSCLQHKKPFMSIRGISNRVEIRNKDNWNIPLAIKNLNQDLIHILKWMIDPD